jgi:hypothetical protein
MQPVLPISTNLSAISKQLLLAIEEKQKIKKSIECVIGTIHYSKFSGCRISRL